MRFHPSDVCTTQPAAVLRDVDLGPRGGVGELVEHDGVVGRRVAEPVPEHVAVVLAAGRVARVRERGRVGQPRNGRGPGVGDLVGQVLAGVDVDDAERAALVAALGHAVGHEAAVGRRVVPVDRGGLVAGDRVGVDDGARWPWPRRRRARRAPPARGRPSARARRGGRPGATGHRTCPRRTAPRDDGAARRDRGRPESIASVRAFCAAVQAAVSSDGRPPTSGTDRGPRRRGARRRRRRVGWASNPGRRWASCRGSPCCGEP